ncbi:MAG: D-alanine--D-alanine ligase [Lachnospiraceae bacterium]|nr:D-alanine--D-alanine ligase [Lachnospiraceae bacterium]
MKIVVLAGGTSTERDVSLVSGAQIYKSLKGAGHDVMLLDVFMGLDTDDIDSVFYRGDELLGNIESVKESNPDIEAVKALRADGGKVFFGPNVIDICKKADIVFMALHGENGENGKVQAAFDLNGIRYTGNDYISSALAMDKALAKEIFAIYGISTPRGYALKKCEEDNNKPEYPVVVKVTDGGSSIGVYIVHNDAEYEKAKKEAFELGNEVVVERFIDGREFSVGVIKGEALPVIEIAPKEGFYDYKNKYQEGSTIETCPAILNDEDTKRIQKMAVDVFKALRLNQYARIDIMMDKSGEIFALEANTLPGMTPTSLMPQEALAAGMSYIDFCEKIMAIALEN